jgi:hypothetical protein
MSGPARRRGGAEDIAALTITRRKKERTRESDNHRYEYSTLKKRAASLLENHERVAFRSNDYKKGAYGVALLWCCIDAEAKRENG